MFTILFILITIGFLIAAYAFHVDKKIKEDVTYKPACDISDYISCSKTVQSPYGNILGFSNAVGGMIYYATLGLLLWLGQVRIAMFLAGLGCIASIILAYILFVKIKAACPLCIALYVINVLLFLLLFSRTM